MQLPLSVSEDSEPEPDLAVVADVDTSTAHPTTAALVIEVARTSQRIDLDVKPALYATAGVPDYWVVDLVARVVHVHNRPRPEGYDRVEQVSSGDVATTGPVDVRLEAAALLAA